MVESGKEIKQTRVNFHPLINATTIPPMKMDSKYMKRPNFSPIPFSSLEIFLKFK